MFIERKVGQKAEGGWKRIGWKCITEISVTISLTSKRGLSFLSFSLGEITGGSFSKVLAQFSSHFRNHSVKLFDSEFFRASGIRRLGCVCTI
jgi:hypothetical protein